MNSYSSVKKCGWIEIWGFFMTSSRRDFLCWGNFKFSHSSHRFFFLYLSLVMILWWETGEKGTQVKGENDFILKNIIIIVMNNQVFFFIPFSFSCMQNMQSVKYSHEFQYINDYFSIEVRNSSYKFQMERNYDDFLRLNGHQLCFCCFSIFLIHLSKRLQENGWN